jgi:hypothetical protein
LRDFFRLAINYIEGDGEKKKRETYLGLLNSIFWSLFSSASNSSMSSMTISFTLFKLLSLSLPLPSMTADSFESYLVFFLIYDPARVFLELLKAPAKLPMPPPFPLLLAETNLDIS